MTPELEQRMTALAKADAVRIAMSIEKKQLKAMSYEDGIARATTILNEQPEPISAITVGNLLRAIPRIRDAKAERILARTNVVAHKRVRDMTPGQRKRVALELARRAA